MATPEIKTHNINAHEVKQSYYCQCGKLPMRALTCGPSGSGNTIPLQNMSLDIYKRLFQ